MAGSISEGAKPVFQPFIRMENQRTTALEDFGELDVRALADVAEAVELPGVRARLADVSATVAIELRVKGWKGGVAAASAYLDLAERELLTDSGIRVVDEFRRGLALAWAYCRRDSVLQERYWALLMRAFKSGTDGSASLGLAVRLVEEVKHRRPDLADACATDMEAAGHRYLVEGNSEAAENSFEHASSLWARGGDTAAAKRCALARGETIVERALSAAGSAMAAAIWLAEGIDVLRRAGAPTARITALRETLAPIQQRSVDELQPIEVGVDIGDLEQEIGERIRSSSLFESLLRMTFEVERWCNYDAVRAKVISLGVEHPFSSFMETQHVNTEGAVIAKQDPLDANDPKSLYETMVHQCREFHLAFRGGVLVSSCADLLFTNFHPSLSEIHDVTRASPLVPEGHEEVMARGLLAGFNGDWLEVGVYLIPCVEPMIRHRFRMHGLITLAMRDDGTESERSLTELLALPDAERVLGKNLILELDALMVHPLGFKLRHHWAHGLLSDDQLSGAGTKALWWSIWRMVLFPWGVKWRLAKQQANEGAAAPPATSAP